MLEYKSIRLHWMGHASFRIMDKRSSQMIYIDPYKLPGSAPPADIILVTHSHPDHLSIEDLNRISSDKTIIIAGSDCIGKLAAVPAAAVMPASPGDTLHPPGLRVQAVHAYNLASQFHPLKDGLVGYIITNLDGVTVYHAGDTDAIPEMSRIQVDIALLPVSGKYTMDAKAAAQATKTMDVKIAVPMHYGSIIGSDSDAKAFQDDAACPVRILEKD